MGRKKIEVNLIENQVSRRATFKQRLCGLLKKIHDLGVLCGVKVNFLCSDTDNNLIYYSNNTEAYLLTK